MLNATISEMIGHLGSCADDCEKQANIIIDFALDLSKLILAKAGIKAESSNWNDLARDFSDDPPEESPDDCFASLWLMRVSASLTNKENDRHKEFELLFGMNRVLDWNTKTNKANRIMTYEETARFVILWFAERIVQIIRKNHWDGISTLPDLFDRLMEFSLPPSTIKHFIWEKVIVVDHHGDWSTRTHVIGIVSASNLEVAVERITKLGGVMDKVGSSEKRKVFLGGVEYKDNRLSETKWEYVLSEIPEVLTFSSDEG